MLRSSVGKALKATLVAAAATAGAAFLLGAESGAAPAPVRATAAKAPGVDQRPFPRTLSFWKCGPEDRVARRDMVVGYGFCSIDLLRRLNPKGIFLLTPGLNPRGLGDYGGMHVTYGNGLLYWTKEGCDALPRSAGPVNLGCVRGFNWNTDFMWNADSTLATIGDYPGAHRGWNIADPKGLGIRELVAKFLAYTAKVSGVYTKRWDGVFSDNWTYNSIGLSWSYGPNLDTDRDGKVDDLDVLRRQWDDGLNEIGNRLRTYLPGKIIAGNGSWYPMWLGYNGSDPQGWLKSSNATFLDDLQTFYHDGAGGPPAVLRVGRRWLGFKDPEGLPRYVIIRQKALTETGKILQLPSGADPHDPKYMLDSGVMRSMRWGLTLALMSGAYYEIVAQGHDGTLWWYDEYDGGKGIRRKGYLGSPLEPPMTLRAGRVWRRDFENGIALNNSTSKSVAIDLKGRFQRLRGTQNPSLNDGKVVTRVTLSGHDGLILLNVKKRGK